MIHQRPHRTAAPRILLCTADVGCGHVRAAQAVNLALRALIPGMQAKTIDALSTTPKWFNRIYRDLYLLVTQHAPGITGWMYDRTDIPAHRTKRDLAIGLESSALRRFCLSEEVRRADLIVCTHFLCARVLSRLRGRGLLRARLAVVITDQHPHAIWRVPFADLFLVASDAAADQLAANGVDSARIVVTGIPIDSRFEALPSPDVARVRQKLPCVQRIILLTGGGLGLGGIDQAAEGILRADRDVFTVIVCGRNESLRQQLAIRLQNHTDRFRVLGLTNRMHELMAAADLIVGKPGGLTTSEAAASGVPMVLLRPLPGQEEHNARALVQSGAAVMYRDPLEAGLAAARLVTDAALMETMRQCARAFGRPLAARSAAAAVMKLCA
ncbi:MAG: UDP-N-acetylglucosamine 2-epimerase [Burkholderiales bacterium]|nr:UDP-N-acetylglucosamine 2-epimerase [Phycisphaerae bacterium]